MAAETSAHLVVNILTERSRGRIVERTIAEGKILEKSWDRANLIDPNAKGNGGKRPSRSGRSADVSR